MGQMKRAAIDGVELEYETLGVGEPIVLVHHGAGADWFNPLLTEPALTGRYCLLRYHRAGYARQQSTARLRSRSRRRRRPFAR